MVVLADRGIVITGASGAGKTQLALALMRHANAEGQFGRLVADDQIFVTVIGGKLMATAPATISGLVEVRGVGPVGTACEAKAPVDLVVRLSDRGQSPRFPEGETLDLLGCQVPLLELQEENPHEAIAAVLARLSMVPFA
ncbi:MAG: HPr kinase/phosphorylase [Rhizobiaceae bacterium]|nr:HPr kinase/phosphorylase [Rhizobiaceae bacterium]